MFINIALLSICTLDFTTSPWISYIFILSDIFLDCFLGFCYITLPIIRFNTHFMVLLKSVYLHILQWVVFNIPKSLVMPTSINFISILFLLWIMMSGLLVLFSRYCLREIVLPYYISYSWLVVFLFIYLLCLLSFEASLLSQMNIAPMEFPSGL